MVNRGVYGRLSDLKARAMGTSTTAIDSVLLGYLEDASRRIDDVTQRHFYSLAAQTRYYAGDGGGALWLSHDLLTITTLKVDGDGDGTFETTLTADTDYWLWPYNRLADEPARRIDLNPNSATLTAWPRANRAVQVVGKFGYSDETAAVRTDTGVPVLLSGALSDSATVAVVDDGSRVDMGETLVLDSEQVYVAAVNANTLTVERGVNGTTAAAHDDDTPVLRRVYPNRVSEVCIELALQAQWGSQRGNPMAEDVGSPSAPLGNVALRNRLGTYRNVAGMVA